MSTISPGNEALASAEKALIFIPDISGFTRFVSDTEISHAQHIINELLSLLLNANQLGMEVSEVEGDAILFFRFGTAPSAEELLIQVKRMFTDFHMHLKKYETHRICNCGACKTAHDLTLKFVAHYGEITINQVQQFKKLFGKDVIMAHRLLKNDIETHEYALFTDKLTDALGRWPEADRVAWGPMQKSMQEYDSGKVNYAYMHLDGLYNQLPTLTSDDFSIHGFTTPIIKTGWEINAPIDLVFDVLSDIDFRSKWIPGTLAKVENVNSEIAQTGQTHKCMANGPVIVSHDFEVGPDQISFSETDTKKTQCVVYFLEKLAINRTRLSFTLFIPRNRIKEFMFKILAKKKTEAVINLSGQNLKQYCEGLVMEKNIHPVGIDLALA